MGNHVSRIIVSGKFTWRLAWVSVRIVSICRSKYLSQTEMFLTEVVEENEIHILHPVHFFVFCFRDHSTEVCLTVRSFPNLWDVEQSAVVIAYRTPPAMGETKESLDWVQNIIKSRLFYLLRLEYQFEASVKQFCMLDLVPKRKMHVSV